MKALFINRHTLSWATGTEGSHLPVEPADRYLITRLFGDGLTNLTPAAFPNTTVIEMSDTDRLTAVARWLVAEHDIDRVVALHEKDMLLAARLREEFDLAGMRVAETLRFRDKLLMKDTLAASGYPGLPRYRALAPGEVVRSLPWSGRTVVKSRWGVGASQVMVADDIDGVNTAARALQADAMEIEAEEYVDGTMYHCDAVVHDGELLFTAVSEYIAAPGHFAPGGVAGSVLLTDGPVRAALLRENALVLRLLGLTSGVTHVEFFRRPSGELIFCEAAARPGGGGIDTIVGLAYGVNLIRAAVELQCGAAPDLRGRREPSATVGVVGIYHSPAGDDVPVDTLREQTPAVLSYAYSTQAVAGAVRHCTDYAHKMIVSADSRDAFDREAAVAVALIRQESPASQRGRHVARP